MRFETWDVLIFPQAQCRIPLQEFKTTCQVIPDPESIDLTTTNLLLPTVTGFIPSLAPGAPFRLSIHSWEAPLVGLDLQELRQLRQLSGHDLREAIMFEARLFVDGRLTGLCTFAEDAPFPLVMDMGVEVDKYGNNEKLQFPIFHKELLQQSHWNAADDFGRLKLIISEGFQGRHPPITFERMRNVVSFSFQHAPLDVLEKASLAYPNAAMWRQPMYTSPSKVKVESVETHAHSPRYSFAAPSLSTLPSGQKALPPAFDVSMMETAKGKSSLSKLPPPPIFKGYRQTSAASDSTHTLSENDVSMGSMGKSRQVSASLDQSAASFTALCEALRPTALPSAPSNTPEGTENTGNSRKPFGKSSGNKRQRTVSAALKAIDAADEPRAETSRVSSTNIF